MCTSRARVEARLASKQSGQGYEGCAVGCCLVMDPAVCLYRWMKKKMREARLRALCMRRYVRLADCTASFTYPCDANSIAVQQIGASDEMGMRGRPHSSFSIACWLCGETLILGAKAIWTTYSAWLQWQVLLSPFA